MLPRLIRPPRLRTTGVEGDVQRLPLARAAAVYAAAITATVLVLALGTFIAPLPMTASETTLTSSPLWNLAAIIARSSY